MRMTHAQSLQILSRTLWTSGIGGKVYRRGPPQWKKNASAVETR